MQRVTLFGDRRSRHLVPRRTATPRARTFRTSTLGVHGPHRRRPSVRRQGLRWQARGRRYVARETRWICGLSRHRVAPERSRSVPVGRWRTVRAGRPQARSGTHVRNGASGPSSTGPRHRGGWRCGLPWSLVDPIRYQEEGLGCVRAVMHHTGTRGSGVLHTMERWWHDQTHCMLRPSMRESPDGSGTVRGRGKSHYCGNRRCGFSG